MLLLFGVLLSILPKCRTGNKKCAENSQKQKVSALAMHLSCVAEAVALGAALGLPRDLLFDTLAKTAVVSPVQAAKLASTKQNLYKPQFPIRLMHKDFGLALGAAARAGLSPRSLVSAGRTWTPRWSECQKAVLRRAAPLPHAMTAAVAR